MNMRCHSIAAMPLSPRQARKSERRLSAAPPTKGKISAKRLLPAARAAGYEGSDRNFRRLVAQERGKYRQAQATRFFRGLG